MIWELVLERRTLNRLNPPKLREKLEEIAKTAERNVSLGFTGRVGKIPEPKKITDGETHDEVWQYLAKVKLEKKHPKNPESAARQYAHVENQVRRKAESEGWTVHSDGRIVVSEETSVDTVVRVPRKRFAVPDLDQEALDMFFEGIYERDAIIRVIHDATRAYIRSLEMNAEDPSIEVARSHILLKGKPAGCKTTLFERFKAWYESVDGVERVLFIDSHTTSKAGLENFLLEKAAAGSLPEVVVLEEVEKQNPDNLLSLVSVMGSGYISKLNARIGHCRELANVLVWATCNDESIIRTFRAGVLWSRFSHRIHCPRPRPELMRKIILNKVDKMDGDPRWAEAALKFAYQEMPMKTGVMLEDPREILALIDGRERLLDHSYQDDLLSILEEERLEAEHDRENARRIADMYHPQPKESPNEEVFHGNSLLPINGSGKRRRVSI